MVPFPLMTLMTKKRHRKINPREKVLKTLGDGTVLKLGLRMEQNFSK